MTAARFTPDLLQNVETLSKWLAHSSHLEPIKNVYTPTHVELLANRWRIHWLETVSYLHENLFAVALKFIEAGLSKLGAPILARRIRVLESYLSSTKNHLAVAKISQVALLSLSRNCHQPGSSDIYLQPSIPTSSLLNENIKALTWKDVPDIDFYHKKGICRGMCFWFIYLYFATRNKFTDPMAHITAVAKQFEEGAPSPAALLQSLEDIDQLIPFEGDVSQVSLDEFKSKPEVFTKFPVGLYTIGFDLHRINYIKISESKSVIFDPNIGTGQMLQAQAHAYIGRLAQMHSDPKKQNSFVISFCTGLRS